MVNNKGKQYHYFLRSTLLVLLMSFSAIAWAKDKKKISYKADKLEGAQRGEESYKQLIDHVVFVHQDITIQADTAQYYDQKGILEAYGHVKIIDDNGSIITAERLIYDTNKKIAQLRDQIVYQADTLTCYTDYLDYEVDTSKGYFFHGGILIEGENIISSLAGCYDDADKTVALYHQVELISQDYNLQCDTLRYNTCTNIARFEGPTKIVTQDGATLTTAEGGEYDTSNKYGTFKHSKVETSSYVLRGNLLSANQNIEYYTATGQVQFVAKQHDITITGDYSEYWKSINRAQLYGNPLMKRVISGDTLYITADTLTAFEDNLPDDRMDAVILAYNNVKIYKSDLQGKADSMAYHSLDSTIYFYKKPIFWCYDNQITAELIRLLLDEHALDKMYMDQNAFIAAADTLGNFNQLKGRAMVAHFKDHKISAIDIAGNGESLYFPIDNHQKLFGMNYIRCSHMHIDIDQEEIARISFLVEPIGLFYPPYLINENKKELFNFTWRIAERPTLEEMLERSSGK